MPKWLKIILTIVAILAGIVVVLFVAAKVAGFGSTMALVYFLVDYLKYIWFERLFK